MSLYISKKRIRFSFEKISNNVRIPSLINVQKKSYEEFLQFDTSFKNRLNQGLEHVLRSIFHIGDIKDGAKLEYMYYNLGESKYNPKECVQRGVDYGSPLRVKLRLILWDCNSSSSKHKRVKAIKEQEVYMGDIPLMTGNGTFIINGIQKVIVSQLHRSPGVFYGYEENKRSGLGHYFARIIPYRGSWIDFKFNKDNCLLFKIDKKKELCVSTLLRAMNYSGNDILREFYNLARYKWVNNNFITMFNFSEFIGIKANNNIIDIVTGKIVVKKGIEITHKLIKKFSLFDNKRYMHVISNQEICQKFLGQDVINSLTGDVIYTAPMKISHSVLFHINKLNIKTIYVFDLSNKKKSSASIKDTMLLDKKKYEIFDKNDALTEIYKILRYGAPYNLKIAQRLFERTFFDNERYDLSSVGRMKINKKHNLNSSIDNTALTKSDIITVIKNLLHIKLGNGRVDDIDSLANRRVRSVGELVENQFRMGLIKTQKFALERMSSVEVDSIMPYDLVNSRALMGHLREFFAISSLSQFLDQTNPLAEITHKRRLSALGPGGLIKERAGFEVRDVHPTHYGRICPIETPEGQNVGLISSLATYAGIDKYGFVESPYRKVKNGYIANDITHLTAVEEQQYYIAKSNTSINKNGQILNSIVTCYRNGEVINASREKVDFISVSSQQLVSIAASLIPFLENNDANRALMGSNMQRQAVPLIKNEAPFVGTGMEKVAACDSGAVILAKRSGIVHQVDTKKIIIKVKSRQINCISGVDIYTLIKYDKSNQSTCINQRPIVKIGEFVQIGDVLADGVSTDMGELALGKNILVAFMPWNGYNFEDSILLSERLIRDDIYTSVHINEYEAITRDTRLGIEEITRDVPNINEEDLKHLDESGIIGVGHEVNAGDILVGKITPKNESPLTPEEKLLRAIFGEKASDVQNSSLRVPPGQKGVVIDVKIFTRRGIAKDDRALAIERNKIEKLHKDKNVEIKIIKNYTFGRVKSILVNKNTNNNLIKNCIANTGHFNNLSNQDFKLLKINDKKTQYELIELEEFYNSYLKRLEKKYKNQVEKLQSGDDLPQSTLKIVKVYIANKLKIQAGDKMSGRHGNKGVVSKIIPIEEMPFLEDGCPVDMVLNPLGVPSRMNIGQILETHLGYAAFNLGEQVAPFLNKNFYNNQKNYEMKLRDKMQQMYNIYHNNSKKINKYIDSLDISELLYLAQDTRKGMKFATPVFNGAKEFEINRALYKAGLQNSGQVILRDGRTGECFDRKITVGYLYMMKLDHLVDNKIHARSTGSYSLVTQQPLGGKSHFGGQRFGEMECWALQAYGAAYTLQEILTIKSDDVLGRVNAYEAIVRGENSFDTGLPESFKVMIKEIQALGLNIETINRKN